MMKLLPLVLLLIGAGAGVGAGIFMRPDAPVSDTAMTEAATGLGAPEVTEPSAEEDEDSAETASDFVKLNNQFVVPIVKGDKVVALIVLALSVEVPAGETDIVYQREPKLRDSFLQVLFDHANIGGFEGNFTDARLLGRLRNALNEIAQKDLGKDIAKDVLIIEIARQDY
jgi:hypothetical protein